MARRIRKYNPGFLTDQELIDSFCVRTGEFSLLVEALRESTGNANPHAIVIGPRGAGKTTLLLRVAAEVRRDKALRTEWFPVVFAEESYEISTCGEFWLQCLFYLSSQAPRGEDEPDLGRRYRELLPVQDDRMLADLALGTILDFADSHGKRLVLCVENLNTMFNDIRDTEVGWQLRKTLQCEPRIFLMGSATSRFNEIDNSRRALYDLFQVHTLKRLDTAACATLWKSVSDREIDPRAVRSLEILTGGNPRLLAIVAEFGSGLSFRQLMDDLLGLVDDHTEYFRSHLQALGAQERRVYLALAGLWIPATARQVSVLARLSASHCSALLKRLVDRGAVIHSGGTPRRREYYLAERMYNIYYLLRRGRGTNQLVEALVRFMTAFYSVSELVDSRKRIISESGSAKGTFRAMLNIALQLLPGPEHLGSDGGHQWFPNGTEVDRLSRKVGEPAQATDLFQPKVREWATKAESLFKSQRYDESIALCDSIEARLGSTPGASAARVVASALILKSQSLMQLDRRDEAVSIYDQILSRFDTPEAADLEKTIASVLANKVALLCMLDRTQDLLRASEDFARRFDSGSPAATDSQRALVIFGRGVALRDLRRPRSAQKAFEEVVERFGFSDSVETAEIVARALVCKAELLEDQGRAPEAILEFEAVIERFGPSPSPRVASAVTIAMFLKGCALGDQRRFDEALACFEELTERCGADCSTDILGVWAGGQIARASILDFLDRTHEAQAAYDAVIGRLASRDSPELAEHLASAFAAKSDSLISVGRVDEAFHAVDEFLKRFKHSESKAILRLISSTLLKQAKLELRSGQWDAGIATAGRILQEFPANPPENQVLARLLRAEGFFDGRDLSGCESELAAMLSLVPEFEVPPAMVIEALMDYTIRFGSQPMLDLVMRSPSEEVLYPFATALRQELGIEIKVPKEVEDVASDIRADLARLRQSGSLRSGVPIYDRDHS